MPVECIPFRDTNYFSSLICDYLDQQEKVKSLYHRFPSIAQFEDQIAQKKASFSEANRKVLVEVLREQYQNTETSEATKTNLELLQEINTFTITTGHQLNLFTGPLYFLYKIVSAINLSKELKEKYPENNFVPIYWMATEDHDFDEINYFNFKGKKIQWNRASSGAVGRLDTKGLDEVLELFAKELGIGKRAESLVALFKNAYIEHATLSEATRYIANEVFREYGLIVIDADDSKLKKLFVPAMEIELKQQLAFSTTQAPIKVLNDNEYKVQVNPREINLFYLTAGLRERIIKEDNSYRVNETDISWTEEDLFKELKEFPERFSPNVIMRPLYQEIILPNLCYIGGGGELAYWFELKSFFEANNVPFPILLLRNSVLIQTAKQKDKLKQLQLTKEEIFLKQHELINRKVRQISNIEIDFSEQKKHLKNQFEAMYKIAEETDVTFLNAVKAQELKQTKGLDALEKRLLKAQKRKLKDEVERLVTIQNELFPNQSLQERNTNFSQFYLEYGEELIEKLIMNLKPLQGEFTILTL